MRIRTARAACLVWVAACADAGSMEPAQSSAGAAADGGGRSALQPVAAGRASTAVGGAVGQTSAAVGSAGCAGACAAVSSPNCGTGGQGAAAASCAPVGVASCVTGGQGAASCASAGVASCVTGGQGAAAGSCGAADVGGCTGACAATSAPGCGAGGQGAAAIGCGTAQGPCAGGGGCAAAGARARNPAAAGADAAAGTGQGGSRTTPAAGSGGSHAAGGGGAITVWIAGDSTVAKGETPCPVGWGADFQSHFGADVKVENSAVGGRSVRTWLYDVQMDMDASGECVLAKDSSGNPTVQPRWQNMLDNMHAGDYLMIQFGINDSSPTCDRHVGIDAFKQSFGVMAQAAKQRGTQPVFLTPVSALSCKGNSAQGTRGAYVTATQDAGRQFDVPVIDLHALSVELYNTLGLCPIPGGGDVSASTGGKTGAFFCDDHTHFERSGEQQIGELIVKALRDQHIGLADRLK